MTRLLVLLFILPITLAQISPADAAQKKKKRPITFCQQMNTREKCVSKPNCHWVARAGRCKGKIGS